MTEKVNDTSCIGCSKLGTCSISEPKLLQNHVYACHTRAHVIKVTQMALSGDGRHTNGGGTDRPIYPKAKR